MIIAAGATGTGEGGVPLLFLGLSGENVTRLAAGEPILVPPERLAALGLPALAVVVHYGKTEEAVKADLAAHGVPLVGAAG